MLLGRGVFQGVLESPCLFVLVTKVALASLHEFWAKRDLGCFIDGHLAARRGIR